MSRRGQQTKKKSSSSSLPTPSPKIALITGANRLLKHSMENSSDTFHLILACRNSIRAAAARESLLKDYPGNLIDIVTVDVSSVEVVFKSCETIRERYDRIDLFFCNAGILQCDYVDWKFATIQAFLDPFSLLTKSEVVVQPIGKVTKEGLGETFASNFFGHYVMIKELEDLFVSSSQGARIIWTSSMTPAKDDFVLEDFQCIKGKNPYESSKYIIDITSVALNLKLNKKNIHNFTTEPGIVATNIVRVHLGWLAAAAMYIAFYLGRFFGINEETITSWNGSYSNYYVAITNPITLLNTSIKYGSRVKPLGDVYVNEDTIVDYDEEVSDALLNKLDGLFNDFKLKYQE
nr:3420_t:CDS:2 [Entrophospora candida]